jgi:hypothetical protein
MIGHQKKSNRNRGCPTTCCQTAVDTLLQVDMGVLSKIKDGLSRKAKKKPDVGAKGGGGNSSSSAPAAIGLPTPASGPKTIITKPLLQQAASSQPLNPTTDPWARAYELFQTREAELMADYQTHLTSLRGDAVTSVDLDTPPSVESIVKTLLEDREKKAWRVSILGKDIKIRKQAERLAKFLLWSDPIVQKALSAQPYAALAWSGVSLLLPVRE